MAFCTSAGIISHSHTGKTSRIVNMTLLTVHWSRLRMLSGTRCISKWSQMNSFKLTSALDWLPSHLSRYLPVRPCTVFIRVGSLLQKAQAKSTRKIRCLVVHHANRYALHCYRALFLFIYVCFLFFLDKRYSAHVTACTVRYL